MKNIKIESCQIWQEKNGSEFVYIESVSDYVLATVIDKNFNYQAQEHFENDEELEEILNNDFELLN